MKENSSEGTVTGNMVVSKEWGGIVLTPNFFLVIAKLFCNNNKYKFGLCLFYFVFC